MSQSYKIHQPITDLASLRKEKQLLRAHIKASDMRMKQTVKEWPVTSLLNGAQTVGKVLFQNNIGSMASGLLGLNATKKGFMSTLVKTTLLFAGTQLVKHFTKDKTEDKEDYAEEESSTNKNNEAKSTSATD